MKLIARLSTLALPLIILVTGCTTLPDVKPFADSTSSLAASAGQHYGSVASEIGEMNPIRMPGEAEASFMTRKKQLEDTQLVFKETDKKLDELFAAMTTYSERVASLTAAGKTGSEAAQSLLDSVKGFADLAGVTGIPAGAAASAITSGFKAIADEFTKMQAKATLKEAVASAEPGVNVVSEQFEVIYGQALQQAASGIRNTRRLQASLNAGPNIIGFHDNVARNYNAYYRYLNGVVTDFDPDKPASAWRGFCQNSNGSCSAIDELRAVGLVEARMQAIAPIVDKYNSEIKQIEDTYKQRQKTSKAVIKAVKAWAIEHRKLRQSLEDGTPLSAFNLKAALIELGNLLSQR